MKRITLFLTTFLFVPFFAFAQMPELLKDINPGAASSEIDGFTKIGNTTFFFADDGTANGYELWRTNGTTAGTQLVQDVNNNTTDGQPVFSNPFSNVIEFNGEAFWLSLELTPVQSEYDLKLWKAGPTGAATLVKQLNVNGFRQYELVNVNNIMYWIQGTETIWQSDGTTAGTVPFLQTTNRDFDKFLDLKKVGSNLFFTRQTVDINSQFDNRIDIWKKNGITGTTGFYKNAVGDAPIDCGLYGVVLLDYNGTLGYILPGTSMCNYRTYLHIDGIGMFEENHAPISSVGIISPVIESGKVFYYAYADLFGDEYDLKSFDGSQTQTIKNLGSSNFFGKIDKLSNGDMIMTTGEALWRSDGTTAGTQILKSFDPSLGTVGPKLLTRNVSDYIFVAIENGVTAFWKTDGTTVAKIAEVPSTAQNRFDSYHVDDLIICGDEIIYSGDDGQSGVELWKMDLNPTPPATCDNNLSNNSGFENGFDGWNTFGNATLTSDANSGSNAVEIQQGAVRILQVLPATPGEEYTAAAQVKTSPTNEAATVRIKFLSSTWQPLDDYGSSLRISGGYETLDLTRTAPANTSWIEVSYFSSSDAAVLVDDVCISTEGTPPTGAELTIMDNPCTSNFPQQGEATFVDFRIKNTGGTTSVEKPIYLYRAKTCRFCSPINIGSVDVPALLPGEDIVLTVSGIDDGMIPGTYNVLGILVPHIYYGYFLSDEIAQFPNNLKNIDFYCKKFNSDLAIEISTDVPEYDATGEITFKLKASNNGNQTAYNVATYFLDDPRLGLTALDNFLTVSGATLQTTSAGVQWVIPQLAAGAMQEIELTYEIFEPSVTADYSLEANISSGHNTNTNTSNDSDSFTFVKMGGPAGGDLVLIATGDPTIPAWSNGIAYFEITNQSGETFENVQVTFDFDSNIRLVGGNEYTSSAGTTLSNSWTSNPVWNVGTIGAGGVRHVALNVYSITNGPMEIYAQISEATGNDVTSTPGNGTPPIVNEDDEVLWQINGGTPPSGQADLTLSNLNLNSTSVEPGEVLNFNFDVANIGNEAVPDNFTIKSYISTDNSLSANDVQDGIITTGNFGAGSSSTDVLGGATIPANLPQGDYYLILKVDADDEVNESNEGNNKISSIFTIDNGNTNPTSPCNIQFSDGGQFNCIQEELGNIKVVYDSADYRIAKIYTPDLDLIHVQTSVPNESSLEWVGSTLTKTNADLSIEYQRTIPQTIVDQLTLARNVIEFGNGFVFFGWEDIDLIDSISVGDEFRAIKTDENFNILTQNTLFDWQDSRTQEISYSNIRALNNTNILLLNRFKANSFTSYRIILLNSGLDQVDERLLASGLSNAGGGYSETSCGEFTFLGSATPLCGTGFCATKTGGDFTIEGNRIVVGFSYTESFSFNQFSSGNSSTSSGIEYKTEDGGKIVSNKTTTVGGQFPSNDDYRTFKKFDSNDKLEWEKTYLIPDAISIRRIFELNGEVFLIKGGSISILDCYDEPAPPATGSDLALAFGPLRNPNPSQWSYFPVSLQVINQGTETVKDITVKFKRADEVVYQGGNEYSASQGSFQHWGNETWTVGELAPGEMTILTVNYYRLSANGFTAFAEVESMSGTDINSTPGNGTCCTANEDDEAILQIGNAARGVNNRAAVAENLGNEIFAIVGANPNPTTGRFNVEVYSNENQTSEITIVDILGRPIFRKEINLNEGHNTIPIELENGGTGIMVVKMTPFHPYLRQIRIMKIRD